MIWNFLILLLTKRAGIHNKIWIKKLWEPRSSILKTIEKEISLPWRGEMNCLMLCHKSSQGLINKVNEICMINAGSV